MLRFEDADVTGEVELPRPTVRSAAPFVLVAVTGLATVALPPYSDVGPSAWLIVPLFGVALVFLGVSLRRTEPSWVDPMGPYVFFLVLALARDATGGATSGLAPLVALPILWLALTGTARQLALASVLTAAVYVVPMLLIGSPDYPASDWRRAVLWVALATIVAPVVQRVVRQLEEERSRARESSNRINRILRGARLTSMVSTDLSGEIQSFSAGAELLLGESAEDVVGRRDLLSFHDPDEVSEVADELGVEPGLAVFAELARQAAPSRIWTHHRDDGQPLFARVALTELRDGAGDLTGYLAVGVDATVAVETRRALIRSEARWRVLLDHLPDLTVLSLDEDLRIQVVAGRGAIRQGMTGAEGTSLHEVSRPENVALVADLVRAALDHDEATGEILSSATGSEHEIIAIALPPDAEERHVLILARDVSEAKQRERDLISSREQAVRLFADAPHGVAVLAVDGTVRQVNSSLTSMIGDVSLVGTSFGDLAPEGDQRLERHLAELRARPGDRVEDAWTLVTARRDEVHVSLSSRLLPGNAHSEETVLVNVIDVSERHRYEQRLSHLADHDALTGLANRRRFDQELTGHLDRCERYGPTGALLLLDLDHFKEVNDTLGHGAGDQLIISIAALLRQHVRSTDVVARLGGDEFAILLPDADRAAAAAVGEAVVRRVRDHAATLDGTRRRVTASIGVVTVKAARQHEADLLSLADMTMYDAKDAGRDQCMVLDESSSRQPRLGARLEWKRRIEAALENDAFELHLQPILDLRTDRVGSAEVLLRLADSDELVHPSRFLYIAERSGQVTELDRWVVRRSVELLAELRSRDPGFTLEVNLSGRSIGQPSLEQAIRDALEENDVEPRALILEITETAAVADVEVARQFAERMTALGCKFALDDFGAGFGSFYYLKHLLFDYVKIDGEFVANAHLSAVDRTIMRSIVGIARGLGKRTVAEFVADPAVLDIVRAEGVDFAQGYLIGEPMPLHGFVREFLPPRNLVRTITAASGGTPRT